MSNRHPIVRMYDLLRKDSDLVALLGNKSYPHIFTFTIPEEYRKTEYAPFVRITEIMLDNTLYNDSDSNHYRFLFAVETFGTTINQVYSISEHINQIIKNDYGRCFDRTLSRDDDYGLFNQMLEFEIILPIKEN